MKRSDIPFNISLLELPAAKTSVMKPVRSLGIFEGNTANFDEDGLFSTSIFGRVGSPERQTKFSYIDLKVPVFHPVIYRAFTSLKRLYSGILDGTEYVLWDDTIGDFVRSNAMHGETGYAYFFRYWKEIKFEQTRSTMREQNILLIENFKEKGATIDKLAVLPAGLRDVEVGEDGRPREDEINAMYRSILSISNTISQTAVKNNPEVINTARYSMQNKFNEIYDTLERMVEGKKKLLMGKWASRNIMNGTRNVITAMDTSVKYLGGPGEVGFNDTIIGLYQGMKALLPVTQFLLRNGFLSKVFRGVDIPTVLVNKKTLHREEVLLKPAYYERWMTDEGIEKIITSFSEESLRDKEIEIADHYIGLMYKGPDMTFRFMQDIRELPEGRDPKLVTPVTFVQLMYLAGYMNWNKYPIFCTRYPVTGMGSIYPSKVFIKTTVNAEVRRELNENWEPMTDFHIAYQFPTKGPYINSLIPHSAKLSRLDADFDGDMMSGNATYTDESIKEVDDFFQKKIAYVDANGTFLSSTAVSTVNLVFHNFTGD